MPVKKEMDEHALFFYTCLKNHDGTKVSSSLTTFTMTPDPWAQLIDIKRSISMPWEPL